MLHVPEVEPEGIDRKLLCQTFLEQIILVPMSPMSTALGHVLATDPITPCKIC